MYMAFIQLNQFNAVELMLQMRIMQKMTKDRLGFKSKKLLKDIEYPYDRKACIYSPCFCIHNLENVDTS